MPCEGNSITDEAELHAALSSSSSEEFCFLIRGTVRITAPLLVFAGRRKRLVGQGVLAASPRLDGRIITVRGSSSFLNISGVTISGGPKGALAVEDGATLILHGCNVTSNRAERGGGVVVGGDTSTAASTSGSADETSSLLISAATTFSFNTATRGMGSAVHVRRGSVRR